MPATRATYIRRRITAALTLLLFVFGAWLLFSPESVESAFGHVFGWKEKLSPRPDGLDHELGRRYDRAAEEAATAGVELYINSGKRDADVQDQMFANAIEQYGSEDEAIRWVLPADMSAHVAGEAIDVAPEARRAWLAANGDRFGLCLVYENEPWHFEALGDVGDPCPSLMPDASHIPQ